MLAARRLEGGCMTALVEAIALDRSFDVSAPWLERALARAPKRWLHAVDGLDFVIERGRTLGLVGESGSGKSTVGRLLVGLDRPTAGSVRFDGRDVLAPGQQQRMQMIFQDPYASLNPRWRVGAIVTEPLVEQGALRGRAALQARAGELLESVGLSAADAMKFPHQFSGGQRQRIAIARAISTQPEFIVCDEPTSALDVSVQAQVLNLLKDLQRRQGLAYLFISHNLAVVRHVSDRVGVMYLGRIVELADKADLFARPRHPYTRMLMAAVPGARMPVADAPVSGEPGDPLQRPAGCAFNPRCPHANARCREERPRLTSVDGVQVACHAVEEGRL
jgi:peptide/nickel transport system ATP-binding protein